MRTPHKAALDALKTRTHGRRRDQAIFNVLAVGSRPALVIVIEGALARSELRSTLKFPVVTNPFCGEFRVDLRRSVPDPRIR